MIPCRKACAMQVAGYQHMVVANEDLLPGDFRLLDEFSGRADPGDKAYRQTFAEVRCREHDVVIDFRYPDGYWANRGFAGKDGTPHVVSWGRSAQLTEHIWRPANGITTILIEEDLLV